MKHPKKRFLVCINNEGYRASLEILKLYQAIPDQRASKLGQVRVIDESGEDYLYAKECFAPTAEESVKRAKSKQLH
jgi:hypothetical protein